MHQRTPIHTGQYAPSCKVPQHARRIWIQWIMTQWFFDSLLTNTDTHTHPHPNQHPPAPTHTHPHSHPALAMGGSRLAVLDIPANDRIGRILRWVGQGLRFVICKPLTELVGSCDGWVAGGGRRSATRRQDTTRHQLSDVVQPPTMRTS